MEEITLKEISPYTSMISLLGPLGHSVMSNVFDLKLAPGESSEGEYRSGRFAVSWTREFNTDFIDVITETEGSSEMRAAILGWKGGGVVREMDPSAYEIFRISRGIPACGSELSELWNPYEVGVAHAISFTKECYTGQEVIARLRTYDKVQRKLVGLLFREPLPETGEPHALFKGTDKVGTVTSHSDFPTDGSYLALGIVSKHAVHTHDNLGVLSDQGVVICTVTDLPISLRLY